MPIANQITALMTRKVISIPVKLPIGSGTNVKVEPFETLNDIKTKSMQEFGINTKRISPDFFTFYEFTHFHSGYPEERALPDKTNVWDLISYWNRSTTKYVEEN